MNGDGTISPEEVQRYKDQSKKLVDAVLSFTLNNGVVAALLLSIVYPMAFQFELDFDWSAFDAQQTSRLLAFLTLLALVLFALILLVLTTRMYTMLSFWMPTLDCQLWFIRDSTNWILFMAFLPIWMLWTAPLALVFNTVGNFGWIGLTSIVPFVLLLVVFYLFEHHMQKCTIRLHKEANRMVTASHSA